MPARTKTEREQQNHSTPDRTTGISLPTGAIESMEHFVMREVKTSIDVTYCIPSDDEEGKREQFEYIIMDSTEGYEGDIELRVKCAEVGNVRNVRSEVCLNLYNFEQLICLRDMLNTLVARSAPSHVERVDPVTGRATNTNDRRKGADRPTV